MSNSNFQLNLGDEIGFVKLGATADDADSVVFFPVAEITTRDNERAYRYMYPDGKLSASAICESQLSSHVIRIRRTVVETIQPVKDKMLDLSERKAEFVEATIRGKNSRFKVFSDWDKDAYVVVNKDNGAEYRVKLETRSGKLHSSCECPDFVYRKRVCKHIGEVLLNGLFSIEV